ncbi:hypothetical protein RI054_01g01630 [Pseudoscourfieldia marina]
MALSSRCGGSSHVHLKKIPRPAATLSRRKFSAAASASSRESPDSSLGDATIDTPLACAQSVQTIITSVARRRCSAHVAALAAALNAQGGTLLDASAAQAAQNSHPYLVPLAVDFAGARVGLLIHPDVSSDADPDMPFAQPIVREHARGASLEVLARSPLEYVNAALVEEDAETNATAIQDAVADIAGAAAAEFYYQPGEMERAKLKLLPQFLATRKIIAPRFAEMLANRHLQDGKNDVDSALVTAEWYLSNLLSAGSEVPTTGLFGVIPHAFQVALLLDDRVDREEEARDAARLALWNGAWWMVKCYGSEQPKPAVEGGVAPLPNLAALKKATGFDETISPSELREFLEGEQSAARARAASIALDAVTGGAGGASMDAAAPAAPDGAARIASMLDAVASDAHATNRTSDWDWNQARRDVADALRERGDEGAAELCEFYLVK